MKKQVKGSKRLQLFWEFHWVKILIGLVLLAAILWPVIVVGKLESYPRTMMLASLSLMPVQSIVMAGVYVFMLYWMYFGGRFSFSQMKRGLIRPEDINVKWAEVIGLEGAKQEAWEIVQLLKDRGALKRVGGKTMRGILLTGPPGCGKTYLAKAIATEAGLPFLSISGSEFIEMFVGVGPGRVRSLFKRARQTARLYGGCIIFIDELDAVGTARAPDRGFGGQTEHNSTVNQLLVEMDGLKTQEDNILVIGATNASESVLDEALMRPGRFDRKIYVDRPDLEGREQLFRFYIGKISAEQDIDIPLLARRAVWKTPAEIENITKEAALIASRNKREKVTFKDVSEAIERLELGFKRHRKLSPDERRRVAYHEAGHVIITYFLHPTDDVFKASIISRKEALGVVYHQPRVDLEFYSSERILADIKASLAGYVAEKLKCKGTSDGVAADFRHATMRAYQMVWRLGMGSSGIIGDFELLLGSWSVGQTAAGDRLSERMKDKLNDETQKIINQCVEEVEALLKKEDALLEQFASRLLEKEELDYDEIEAVFAHNGRQRVHS